jgi:hypothetical protein
MLTLYIDPGSGSLVIQILIAGAISVLMLFKNVKIFLNNFFNKLFKRDKKDL